MTTETPTLQGFADEQYDGRYRLYTHEHVAFDALPDWRDGGPARVVIGGWVFSTSTSTSGQPGGTQTPLDNGQVTLRAHRGGQFLRVAGNPQWVPEYHPLDGTKYPTQRDADKAAFEAGLIAFMVYERNAGKWGLGTPADA